jgi:hypothetical protein
MENVDDFKNIALVMKNNATSMKELIVELASQEDGSQFTENNKTRFMTIMENFPELNMFENDLEDKEPGNKFKSSTDVLDDEGNPIEVAEILADIIYGVTEEAIDELNSFTEFLEKNLLGNEYIGFDGNSPNSAYYNGTLLPKLQNVMALFNVLNMAGGAKKSRKSTKKSRKSTKKSRKSAKKSRKTTKKSAKKSRKH